MNTLKNRILNNWHLARIVRAALAVWMLTWCIQTHDWGIAFVSLILLAMAATNTGCCGSHSCSISKNKAAPQDIPYKTDFEEII